MKKLISIVLISFLLTGCTVNYDLNIKNDGFEEAITGRITKDEIENNDDLPSTNIYRELLYEEQNPLNFGSNTYVKKITENESDVQFSFNYFYSANDYMDSRVIDRCFSNSKIEIKDDFYYISVFGKYKCLYSDPITINVKSDYRVISNNAQKVNKSANMYTWTIDENNVDDIDIKLSVSRKEKVGKINYKFEVSTFKWISLVVLIVLSGVTYFLYRKKNSGKI